MTDNPSATYRGYRRQAVYTLWRVLTSPDGDDHSYRPEGEEDLAVFDGNGRLVEAVQVKDFSTPLSLSNFKPGSPEGYFARMKRRQTEHPRCKHVVATFGPLGEELQNAIAGAVKREEISRKINLKNPSISVSEASELLHALTGNIRFVDEPSLQEGIKTTLKDTIGGIKDDVAIELLLYWVYDASERQRIITRSTILLQLQRIGNYLCALRDHTSEWMVAIWPLEGQLLWSGEKERLRNEFSLGVQARWQHILADADCIRPARLAELHEKVSQHSAVIVRGASGQGKSSLAFRYVHEYCAEGVRFQIRYIEGRSHAARLANALRGHIQQLRLRAVVLLDLAPSDSGWAELVRELVDAGLKVIVTVREEDYRRAGVFAPGVDVTELVLDSITREEAESVYQMLTAIAHSSSSLDFDDAWARFSSADAAPLLEFTHLVTEGQSLAATVTGQVTRLQREASSGKADSGLTAQHLKLLGLAVVANSAECRVRFKQMCMAVGVDPLIRPLQVLEDEYLVRQTQHGSETTITGLHPLRSQAIEAALLNECPEIWGDLAIQCIPLIVDEDIERFLLHAFSRHPEDAFKLEIALHDVSLTSWTHAGGIGRALLWEGVSRYVEANHKTLADTVATHSSGWWMFCDSYIGMDSTYAENFWSSCEEIFKNDIPKVYLTKKDDVFTPFADWAKNVDPPGNLPKTSTDWVLAGDLAFWAGRRNIASPLISSLQQLLPEPLPQDISLHDFARFISGRSALNDTAFTEWHSSHAYEFAQLFLEETSSVHVADDGEEVKVFFPVVVADTSSEADHASLHAQTIRRIQLLREIYPDRRRFGSQGVGMEVLEALLPHDETQKSIPAENIPPERAIQLNANFISLVNYRFRRANSWADYADVAFQFRRSVCDCFHQLQRTWSRFLKEGKVDSKIWQQLPGENLDKVQKLSSLPMYPKTAVDPYGFISETMEKNTADSHAEMRNNLKRFDVWKKAWCDYENGVGQVAHLTLGESLRHVLLKINSSSESVGAGEGDRLLFNLSTALEALPSMQMQFRRWFSRYVPPHELQELEIHEATSFKHLWAVAFNFIHSPNVVVEGGAAALERGIAFKRREFLRHLKEHLGSVMSGRGTVTVLEKSVVIDGSPNLVIVCNHDSLNSMETVRPKVVQAIWEAAQAQSWQNLEWHPLVLEWPRMFVTHTIGGRALFAGGTSLNSFVIFGTLADFEVHAIHLLEMPVSNNEYRALGLRMWETPLLAAVINFQGAFLAFIFTLPRFYGLMKVATEYGLSDEHLQRYLRTFSKEITSLRSKAQECLEDVTGLLTILPHAAPDKKELVDNLQQLSQNCLFIDATSEADFIITTDVFFEWAIRIEENINEANTIFAGMLNRAMKSG